MLIAKVSPVLNPQVHTSTMARRAVALLAVGCALLTLGWTMGSACAVAQTPDSTTSTPTATTTQTSAQDSARARALAAAQAQAAAQAAAAAQAKGKKGKQSKQSNPATPVKQSNPATPVTQGNPATPVKQSNPTTPVTQGNPTTQVTQGKPTTPVNQNNPAAQVTQDNQTTQVTQGKQAKRGKPAKQSKQVYTGPNTVETLPPKPMLDEEGKQRVDPDGNLMFYPVVQQIRDKKGHPVFDRAGNPVYQTANNMGYDEKGKKIVVKKERQPRRTPVTIQSGTLTVDGWTNKARINFNIPDLKYIYVYVPGIGTTIVSPSQFPGATEQAGAFKDNTLRVTVEGHPIELTSERTLLGRGSQKAWVAVDREFVLPTKYPTIGYGTTMQAPYVWPGSKTEGVEAGVNMKKAPPLPADMVAAPLSPCPTGMIRKVGPPVQPGQIEPEQPCVRMQTNTASAEAATATASSAETSSAPTEQPPK
jgi:hypothetical protein